MGGTRYVISRRTDFPLLRFLVPDHVVFVQKADNYSVLSVQESSSQELDSCVFRREMNKRLRTFLQLLYRIEVKVRGDCS